MSIGGTYEHGRTDEHRGQMSTGGTDEHGRDR